MIRTNRQLQHAAKTLRIDARATTDAARAAELFAAADAIESLVYHAEAVTIAMQWALGERNTFSSGESR